MPCGTTTGPAHVSRRHDADAAGSGCKAETKVGLLAVFRRRPERERTALISSSTVSHTPALALLFLSRRVDAHSRLTLVQRATTIRQEWFRALHWRKSANKATFDARYATHLWATLLAKQHRNNDITDKSGFMKSGALLVVSLHGMDPVQHSCGHPRAGGIAAGSRPLCLPPLHSRHLNSVN